MKRIIIIFAVVLVAAVSCSKQEMTVFEKGMGALSVSMNLSEQTRAAMDAEELQNSAKVNIYKADFSGLVRSYTYANIPSPFYLAADNYRVDVIAGEAAKETPAVASWEQKSYKGSEEFTITAGEVTTVAVEAGVNNAVTKITFDKTIVDNFNAGYTFTIGLDVEDEENATATQLVYDASKNGAEGYFIVAGLYEPSLTWTFSGNLLKDGSTFTKTGVIENVEPGKLYKMNLIYTIKDGELDFDLVVDYSTDIVDDTIVFEPVSTGLAATPQYEVWATHTTVYADVDATENVGKTVKFGYKIVGSEGDYTYVNGVNSAEGSWKAELTGLTPATEYSYILSIGDEENGYEQVGDPSKFTTEAAPKLPNGSFEYVSKVTGEDYYKFYDPNCGVEEGQKMFWGSGNGEGSEGVNGSASMNIVITDIDNTNKVDGNQSVVCQNDSMAGLLTAGNLFTGQFNGLVGTEGGKVNFGRPWTSRPKALKIYCKYETGKINILKNNNLGVSTSDYDRAQIKVAIGTWGYKTYGGTKDSPILINTTDESTFVDFYTDTNTIANGDLIIYNDGYSINKAEKVTATTSGWIEYTIPLDYRNLTTSPTHIVISCATSQFGDYFTGYDGGKLWIDKAELIY